MTYNYLRTSKRLALFAYGWFFAFLLLRVKELSMVIKGHYNGYLITILILQLIIVPGFLLLKSFRFKRVNIATDDDGLIFNSAGKKINIQWNEIMAVKRGMSGIKIFAGDKSIPFFLTIEPESVTQPATRYGMAIFKNCVLLQEIRAKAKDAKFKDFPEGAF